MHTVHYHDNDSEDTLTYVECTQYSKIKKRNIFASKIFSFDFVNGREAFCTSS